MKKSIKTMAQISMIAALYATITLAIPFLSFGTIQFRFSEALTILPAHTANAIPGLTLGCFVANFVGFLFGANHAGLIDSVFGSIASLIAAILTFHIAKNTKGVARYILSPLPAVVINAIVIGFEISYFFMGTIEPSVFLINFTSVFLGQLTICYTLGFPLMYILDKKPKLLNWR